MSTKTKERLIQAKALAEETFGQEQLSQNPGIVGSILISMVLDDLSDSIKQENEKLTECIIRSASQVAD